MTPRPPAAASSRSGSGRPRRGRDHRDRQGLRRGERRHSPSRCRRSPRTCRPTSSPPPAGNGPDVVIGAHDWIGNLVQNGAIDPVQLTAEQTSPRFSQTAVKAVTFNGQLYGVPYDDREPRADPQHRPRPRRAPTTIEDLVAAGKALKAGRGQPSTSASRSARTATPTTCTRSSPPAAATCSAQAANGDYDPTDLGVGKPESIDGVQEDRRARREGRGRAEALHQRRQLHRPSPAGSRAFLVSGPWAVTDVKKAGITYDISAGPRLRRRQAGPAVHRRRRRSTWPARARTRRWPRSS